MDVPPGIVKREMLYCEVLRDVSTQQFDCESAWDKVNRGEMSVDDFDAIVRTTVGDDGLQRANEVFERKVNNGV